jgi:hypothetical protein
MVVVHVPAGQRRRSPSTPATRPESPGEAHESRRPARPRDQQAPSRPRPSSRPQSTCSVKVGDGLNLSVTAVHEHLARRVLTGDTDGVLDRVVELLVGVELLSTPTAQPGAVVSFDYPKEVRARAYNSRRRQPNNEGPEVLTMAPFVRATRGEGIGSRAT